MIGVLVRKLTLALVTCLAAALPANAQTVTLDVCNTGTIDIDVFTLQDGPARSSNIKPSTCGAVATGKDGIEAYLGLAFVDSRGQWGAPTRFDNVPNMGVRELPQAAKLALALKGQSIPAAPKILSTVDKPATVRHANAFATLPMQLFFQPAFPLCRLVRVDVSDERKEQVCEDLVYTLMVEAHADSHEASLGRLPVGGGFEDYPPLTARKKPVAQVNWAEIAAARKQRPAETRASAPPTREQTSTQNAATIGSTASSAGLTQSVAGYQPSWIGHTMIVAGTVSRFVRRDVNGEPYVYLYFKERPDSTVVACTRDADWLLGVLGVDDFDSVVGTTLEFRGEVVKGTCTEQGAGLWIYERTQARIAGGPAR